MTNSITYIQLIIRPFQNLQNNFNNQISILHWADCMWLITISSKTTLWLLVLPCICLKVMSSICYYYLPLYWYLLLVEVNSFIYLLSSLVWYPAEIIINYNSFTLNGRPKGFSGVRSKYNCCTSLLFLWDNRSIFGCNFSMTFFGLYFIGPIKWDSTLLEKIVFS